LGEAPTVPAEVPTLEQAVRAWHEAGTSQRAVSRELRIGRHRRKGIIEQTG